MKPDNAPSWKGFSTFLLDITGRLAGSVGLWTLRSTMIVPLGPWNQEWVMLLIVLD